MFSLSFFANRFEFTLAIKPPNFSGATFSQGQSSPLPNTTISNNGNSVIFLQSNNSATMAVSVDSPQGPATKLKRTVPESIAKEKKQETSPKSTDLAHESTEGGVDGKHSGSSSYTNPAFEADDPEKDAEKEERAYADSHASKNLDTAVSTDSPAVGHSDFAKRSSAGNLKRKPGLELNMSRSEPVSFQVREDDVRVVTKKDGVKERDAGDDRFEEVELNELSKLKIDQQTRL